MMFGVRQSSKSHCGKEGRREVKLYKAQSGLFSHDAISGAELRATRVKSHDAPLFESTSSPSGPHTPTALGRKLHLEMIVFVWVTFVS